MLLTLEYLSFRTLRHQCCFQYVCNDCSVFIKLSLLIKGNFYRVAPQFLIGPREDMYCYIHLGITHAQLATHIMHYSVLLPSFYLHLQAVSPLTYIPLDGISCNVCHRHPCVTSPSPRVLCLYSPPLPRAHIHGDSHTGVFPRNIEQICSASTVFTARLLFKQPH